MSNNIKKEINDNGIKKFDIAKWKIEDYYKNKLASKII
jgi:hypothetical protein